MTTKFAKAKYTEYYDVGTRSGRLTVLGISTPTGAKPRQMLAGFFNQFRFFKYSGCKVKMHPSATLPADPLGVGYEAGELQMDPRENLNPIITKGCHGSSLNDVLDQVFSSSNPTNNGTSVSEYADGMDQSNVESMYYAALSDPSFKKWGIQSGLSLSCYPLIYPLAATRVIIPSNVDPLTGAFQPSNNSNPGIHMANEHIPYHTSAGGSVNSFGLNQMFTSGAKKLSWLPTRTFYPGNSQTATGSWPSANSVECHTWLPKILMSVICLPPSYKVEQYFRIAITHYFSFKGFSTSLVGDKYVIDSTVESYTNSISDPTSTSSVKTLTYDEMVNSIQDANSIDTENADVTLVSSGVY